MVLLDDLPQKLTDQLLFTDAGEEGPSSAHRAELQPAGPAEEAPQQGELGHDVAKSPGGAGQAEGGGEAGESDNCLHNLSGQDNEGTRDYVAHFLPPMKQDPGLSIIQDL